jgi:hypothetical protein
MSLENLLRIGQLKQHETDAAEVGRMLEAVRRNIADAQAPNISHETRFDAAYKAVMQLGLVALMANGFRPDMNKPGHHVTAVQSLAKSIGLDGERVTVLDALRRKRNLADYTGQDVDHASVDACIEEAKKLLRDVEAWLGQHRPNLAPGKSGAK